MIKKITLIAAIVLFAFGVNAQIKLSAGLGLALPIGDFGDAAKTGFGGNIAGKYMLNEKMAVGANIGYFAMGEKIKGVKFSVMPITGSFTYYFAGDKLKPYAGADLGIYSLKSKSEFFGKTITVSDSYFGFAPTVGFEYGLTDILILDVNAKYNYIMSDNNATSFIGINVGIIYPLSK